jgi:hypothetical protein
MKTGYKVLGMVLLAACSFNLGAQEQPVEAKTPINVKKPEVLPSKMGDMTEVQKDQYLHAMQDHLLEMHELSDRIIAEQDPVKKQVLKDQQFRMMKLHKVRMLGRLQNLRDR